LQVAAATRSSRMSDSAGKNFPAPTWVSKLRTWIVRRSDRLRVQSRSRRCRPDAQWRFSGRISSISSPARPPYAPERAPTDLPDSPMVITGRAHSFSLVSDDFDDLLCQS
jgi:hypothetical protein